MWIDKVDFGLLKSQDNETDKMQETTSDLLIADLKETWPSKSNHSNQLSVELNINYQHGWWFAAWISVLTRELHNVTIV